MDILMAVFAIIFGTGVVLCLHGLRTDKYGPMAVGGAAAMLTGVIGFTYTSALKGEMFREFIIFSGAAAVTVSGIVIVCVKLSRKRRAVFFDAFRQRFGRYCPEEYGGLDVREDHADMAYRAEITGASLVRYENRDGKPVTVVRARYTDPDGRTGTFDHRFRSSFWEISDEPYAVVNASVRYEGKGRGKLYAHEQPDKGYLTRQMMEHLKEQYDEVGCMSYDAYTKEQWNLRIISSDGVTEFLV